MSDHMSGTENCPPPKQFTEAEGVLSDLTALEAEIAREVRRLERANAPASEAVAEYRDRPIWWWRVMLVSWAWSLSTEQAHTRDTLRGLRVVLKEWDDTELTAFLDEVLAEASANSAA